MEALRLKSEVSRRKILPQDGSMSGNTQGLENRELMFNGTEFVWGDGKVLEMGAGNGCTTTRMYLMLQSTLKNA